MRQREWGRESEKERDLYFNKLVVGYELINNVEIRHWALNYVYLGLGVLICLDRDSRSRHWQRAGLNSRDFLDSLKNRSRLSRLVSTVQKTKSRHGLCPKISVFVNISIENLDLDTFKSWSWHFQKLISTCWEISISIGLNCRDHQAYLGTFMKI